MTERPISFLLMGSASAKYDSCRVGEKLGIRCRDRYRSGTLTG